MQKNANKVISAFFILFFVGGLTILSSYGISSDEATERETSLRQYQFAVSKIFSVITDQPVSHFEESHVWYQNYLQGSRDRNYGTFLQWPTLVIEHITGFTLEPTEIYTLRHIFNFTYFFIALVCFFALLNERFKNRWLAFLGVIIVILTPRFFAESFYNNKDILLASTYIIAIYFGNRFWKNKTLLNCLLASVTSSIAMNTRVVAILVPISFLSLMLTDFVRVNWKNTRSQPTHLSILIWTLLFSVFTFLLFIFTHPTSWGRELNFLPEVFKFFSQYSDWTGKTLYFGSFVPYNEIPWHYTLGYFIATTPIVYVALIFVSILTLIYQYIRIFVKQRNEFISQLLSLDIAMVGFWLAPLVAVIIFESVLYSSWRHMYFIYFPLVYSIVWLFHLAQKSKNLYRILLSILLVSFCVTGFWMVQNHPYQFAYFSPLFRTKAAENFERDYWHLTAQPMMREILELENGSVEKIKIWQNDPLVLHIRAMADQAERERFEFVPTQSAADYAWVLYYNTKETTPWNILYEHSGMTSLRDLGTFEIIKEIRVDSYPLSTLMRNTGERVQIPENTSQDISESTLAFQELTIPYLRQREYKSQLTALEPVGRASTHNSFITKYDSDGFAIQGLITQPTGEMPANGWPAIVFVHGYIPPTQYRTLERYQDYVNFLARNGFVVFKIDLRGHGESEGEPGGAYYSSDYVIDTLNAVAALQSSNFVNPQKIGLWGHSMAGNVVLRSLAAQPNLKAGVIWAGAGFSYEDLQEFGIDDNSYRPPSPESPRQQQRQQLFETHGRFSPDNPFWQQVAPTNYLSDFSGAIQLHHAVNDTVVDVAYSQNLAEILSTQNIPHELYTYQSGGHNIDGSSFTTAMNRSVEFFKTRLSLENENN